MTSWEATLLLVLQGVAAGIVIGQVIRLHRQGKKVSVTLDERPVSRLVLAAAVIALVIATTTLIRVDYDTRDCVEDALESIVQMQTTGRSEHPIVASC